MPHRLPLAAFILALAGPAQAHPGHIAEVAGHGHWIALGALGLAIGIGAVIALGKRKGEAAEDTDEAEADEEPAT